MRKACDDELANPLKDLGRRCDPQRSLSCVDGTFDDTLQRANHCASRILDAADQTVDDVAANIRHHPREAS